MSDRSAPLPGVDVVKAARIVSAFYARPDMGIDCAPEGVRRLVDFVAEHVRSSTFRLVAGDDTEDEPALVTHAQARRMLGVSESTLYRRIKKHNIATDDAFIVRASLMAAFGSTGAQLPPYRPLHPSTDDRCQTGVTDAAREHRTGRGP